MLYGLENIVFKFLYRFLLVIASYIHTSQIEVAKQYEFPFKLKKK